MKKHLITSLITVMILCGCSSNSSSNNSLKDRDSYSFNKYSLQTIYQNKLSTKEKDTYKQLVDGLYDHQDKVKIDMNEDEYNNFFFAFFNNCPLASYLTDYDLVYENGYIKYSYTCSKDKADKIINKFEKTVTSIVNKVSKKSNQQNKLIRELYLYMSKNIEYDNDEHINDLGVNSAYFAYDVIVNKYGFCKSISDAFAYLLSQIDMNIKCYEVNDNNDRHQWVMIQMENGKYYHFDATFQNAYQDYDFKDYYGMSDEVRALDFEQPFHLACSLYPDFTLPKCDDNISSTVLNPDDDLIGD